jgi:putative nucleotidyltransferase with HDIG domain
MSTQPARVPFSRHPTSAEIVLRTEDLPPFPEIAWKVIDLASDPNTGARSLEKVIQRDQSLTARILRLANSAYFQRSRQVKTVREAAALLGNDQIRSLVVTAALKPIMAGSPVGKALWEHALAVALGARLIAASVNEADPEEAFVAGLLHDVGKSLFDRQHPRRFAQAVGLQRERPDISPLEIERRVMGVTHTEAGAVVAMFWRLPPALAEAILYHHHPELSSAYPRLCAVVHLADLLALRQGVGLIPNPDVDPLSTCASWLLHLTPSGFQQIAQYLRQELGHEKRQLGVE